MGRVWISRHLQVVPKVNRLIIRGTVRVAVRSTSGVEGMRASAIRTTLESTTVIAQIIDYNYQLLIVDSF